MQPITSADPVQGVIFDFGSTLAICRQPWVEIIPRGGAALTGRLQAAGQALPAGFADLWVETLRASIRQAEADGVERAADAVLADLLAGLGHVGLPDDLIRAATDCFFAEEDAARAPATGAAALLAELRGAGYRLGLLSNTIGGRWVRHWAEQYGFSPHLDALVTSDEIGVRKPRPEIFLATLARMGLTDPARAVMVGDTVGHDIVGARAAGMRAVLVTLAEDRSFSSRTPHFVPAAPADAAAPDAQISELAALVPLLTRWQADGR